MVKHKFVSMDELGGFEPYLNALKAKHNGLGYDDLIERLRLRVPLKRIADDFGVHYTTVKYSWMPKIPEGVLS